MRRSWRWRRRTRRRCGCTSGWATKPWTRRGCIRWSCRGARSHRTARGDQRDPWSYTGNVEQNMLASILLGSSLAFAAAIQPGPLQAYLLSSTARHGWKRTLPAALAPLLSDAPIVLTSLFVLTRLPDVAEHVLQAAGGVLL